jgi:hypothetical protein
MVKRGLCVQAEPMGTMPPGPQYRLALTRIATFIGALQQVRRVEPARTPPFGNHPAKWPPRA